jgi:hypothetical protein
VIHHVHQHSIYNILGSPAGLPPHIPGTTHIVQVPGESEPPPIEMPAHGLQRAVNYLADYGGCSFYRCMGPNMLLNLSQKAVILELTSMVLDPRFYQDVKCVKLQRQATPQQLEFVKLLKKYSADLGFKIVYEVDDIVFSEDIPMYNRNRDAFATDEIRKSVCEIMELADEITVTCPFMRDYFKSKLKNQNVTAIPNYLMKWWFDRYYNVSELSKRFEQNKKKRHVVSIFASGTHVDVMNRCNQQDDFAHVVHHIIKTRKQYKWQFFGSHPLAVRPFIDSGEMSFVPWVDLHKFPEVMYNSGTELCFAALQDNTFNRGKSCIKLIEAGALGIPCVCPDMCTYSNALLKYTSGDEFIDQIKYALQDHSRYVSLCKKSRDITNKYWLDDEPNLMKFHEAYFTPIEGERKFIATS